jgi:molybdopterin-containing oxidoreductase family iron-sulfur binding subunit
MSRHYQFESNFSLTGANADYRFALKPSKESDTILALYNVLAKQLGKPILRAPKISNSEKIFKVAKDLWDNRGKSLVVSSSNNPDVQVLVNAINYLLNNYGKTIFLDSPVNYK